MNCVHSKMHDLKSRLAMRTMQKMMNSTISTKMIRHSQQDQVRTHINQDDQTLSARPGEEMHFSMDFLLGPQQVQQHPLEPSSSTASFGAFISCCHTDHSQHEHHHNINCTCMFANCPDNALRLTLGHALSFHF